MLVRIKESRIIVYGVIDSTNTEETASKLYRNESLLSTAVLRDNTGVYLLFRNGNTTDDNDKIKLSDHIQYGFVLNDETIVNEMVTEGEGDPTPNIINADDFITAFDDAVKQVALFFLNRNNSSNELEWLGYFLQYDENDPQLTPVKNNVGDLVATRDGEGQYIITPPEELVFTDVLLFASPTGDDGATPRFFTFYLDGRDIRLSLYSTDEAFVDWNGLGTYGFPLMIKFFNN